MSTSQYSTERKAAFEIGIMEIASKAIEKMFDALDNMQPGQLPIAAGIGMDEGLRLLEIGKRGGFSGDAPNIQINFIAQRNPNLPDVVEGEVVKDDS